jgi:hypothetical protein
MNNTHSCKKKRTIEGENRKKEKKERKKEVNGLKFEMQFEVGK